MRNVKSPIAQLQAYNPVTAMPALSDFASSFETPEASAFAKAIADASSDRPSLFLDAAQAPASGPGD
jgi:hypothetical protein